MQIRYSVSGQVCDHVVHSCHVENFRVLLPPPKKELLGRVSELPNCFLLIYFKQSAFYGLIC